MNADHQHSLADGCGSTCPPLPARALVSTLRERCIEAMTSAVWPDGKWSAEAESMLDALLPVLSDAIKPHRWDMDYPDSKPPECGSSFADSFYSGVLHSARVVRELLPPVVREPSQTSTGVDAVPDERQSDPAAHSVEET